MGKIISIVNRKGGVGKTTLTLGLADTLTGSGIGENSVVVVDLDPQASASLALVPVPPPTFRPWHLPYQREQMVTKARWSALVAMAEQRKTVYDLIDDRINERARPIENYILSYAGPFNECGYGVLANTEKGWAIERKYLVENQSLALESKARDLLDDLKSMFDYVIVDCPPGQTILSEAAIGQSNIVLCPVTPEPLAMWGLDAFENYIRDVIRNVNDQGEKIPDPIPKAFFVAARLRRGSFGPNHPQNLALEQLKARSFPAHIVTLLKESGEDNTATTLSDYAFLEDDARLRKRMDGNPNPHRVWDYERMYSNATRMQLSRIAERVKRRLEGG